MSADESITSLSEAVAALGALPVPVGPEPQEADADTVAARAAQVISSMGAELRGLKKESDRLFLAWGSARMRSRRKNEALKKLRARVTELEAERDRLRQLPDLPVDKLAKALLLMETGPALPWAHVMPDGDLGGFLDDLVSAALNRWRTDPDGPVPDRVTLADIERVCREWRTPGQGYRSDPEPEAVPDAVTAVFSPVASLREPEPEFYGSVHHSYRVPRDLPETGGTQ